MADKLMLGAVALAVICGAGIGATSLLDHGTSSATFTPLKPPPAARPTDARTQEALALNENLSHTPIAELPDPGPLPASLKGARHDVQLSTDAQGNLQIDEGLVHLFDFYLSGLEEEGVDKVLARIHRDLAAQLQGAALAQARELLRRYIDYRIALQDLPKNSPSLNAIDLRNRLDAINALRAQYFSAQENEAFFSRQNAEDNYMLQRLAIGQQEGLSPAQQQQAINELEHQLPAELREARAQAGQHADVYGAAQALRAQGASAEQIHQLREQALGKEAAEQLAELDQQYAVWEQRLADYASERNRLRQSGLNEADLQNAIHNLQTSRFDELEQRRVQALDADL
ncbi:lipase secretion chaperone [Pseudomonas sp. Marseille-Q8238]